MAHRRRASEQIQDAMSVAISSLDLGAPERVTRANARADGASTPIPPYVSFLLYSPRTVRISSNVSVLFQLDLEPKLQLLISMKVE